MSEDAPEYTTSRVDRERPLSDEELAAIRRDWAEEKPRDLAATARTVRRLLSEIQRLKRGG